MESTKDKLFLLLLYCFKKKRKRNKERKKKKEKKKEKVKKRPRIFSLDKEERETYTLYGHWSDGCTFLLDSAAVVRV